MSNEEANELWDEIGKRATVRSRVAAKVVREGKNIRLKIEVGGDELLLLLHMQDVHYPTPAPTASERGTLRGT